VDSIDALSVAIFFRTNMKVETPQILWHAEGDKKVAAALSSVSMIESGLNKEKVFTYVLASASGTATAIHLWKLEFPTVLKNTESSTIFESHTATKIEFMCALDRHEDAVTAVKFSPDGMHLATASENGGAVIVWSVPANMNLNNNGKHYWSTLSTTNTNTLSAHIALRNGDGVTDLSWSSDSKRFLASTLDSAVLVLENINFVSPKSAEWRTAYRGTNHHTHFVQGVAYDPCNVYLASQSSDRTVKVLIRKQTNKLKKSGNNDPQLRTDLKLEIMSKGKQLKYLYSNKNADEGAAAKKQHMFADESTLAAFVRRLDWTPDGAYLLVPAALHHNDNDNAVEFATLAFQRHCFDEPVKVFGGLDKVCTLCVLAVFSLVAQILLTDLEFTYNSAFHCGPLESSSISVAGV
jgi:WD40 repeat protein